MKTRVRGVLVATRGRTLARVAAALLASILGFALVVTPATAAPPP